tara:strand:+ start:326 stop:1270 length:945 start_codon:yes stop_codon:yes gene_type:complete
MKKLLGILVLGFLLISNAYAKNLDIDNKILLDVPNSHEYIKIDKSSSSTALYGLVEVLDDLSDLDLDVYIVGPEKFLDVFELIFDGTDIQDLDVLQPIIRKSESKNFSSYLSQMKWLGKEFKKLMKKEKVDFYTYVVFSNEKIKNIEDDDFKKIIIEHENMNNEELKVATKIYRKEITSIVGDNKTIPLNDEMTLTIKKFNISKNQNNTIYLEANFIGSWLGVIDFNINMYLSKKNDQLFLVASECWVNCSNQSSRFKKMLKPMFTTNTQVKKTTSNISEDGNLTEQLKALHELYKAGALTKEEFEKAKKKLLN